MHGTIAGLAWPPLLELNIYIYIYVCMYEKILFYVYVYEHA